MEAIRDRATVVRFVCVQCRGQRLLLANDQRLFLGSLRSQLPYQERDIPIFQAEKPVVSITM